MRIIDLVSTFSIFFAVIDPTGTVPVFIAVPSIARPGAMLTAVLMTEHGKFALSQQVQGGSCHVICKEFRTTIC